MEEHINSTAQAESFEAAEAAIGEWQKALNATETAQAQIVQFRRELQMLNHEETALLADSSSDDRATSKKTE